jgi:hypothetical protein
MKIKTKKDATLEHLSYWFDNVRWSPNVSEPKSHHTKCISKHTHSGWKTVTRASNELVLPLGMACARLNHVETILPARYIQIRAIHVRDHPNASLYAACLREGLPEVINCWWFKQGRGKEVKVIKGLYHVASGTHAPDKKKLERMLKAQLLAAQTEKRRREHLERAKKRRLPILRTSARAGNCPTGTINFLKRMGVTRKLHSRISTYGAIERLAKKHKMNQDYRFRAVAAIL